MPLGGNALRGRGFSGLGRVCGPIDGNFSITPSNAASPSFRFNAGDAASGLAVSSDGYTVTRDGSATAYKSVRGSTGRSSGIYQVSFWPGADAIPQMGFETESGVGFANATQSLTTAPYTVNSIYWIAYEGDLYINGAVAATWRGWNGGDQIDMVLDFTNSKVYGRVNGGYWNNDAAVAPASDNGLSIAAYAGGTTYPFVCLRSGAMNCRSKFVQVAAPALPTGVSYPWE